MSVNSYYNSFRLTAYERVNQKMKNYVIIKWQCCNNHQNILDSYYFEPNLLMTTICLNPKRTILLKQDSTFLSTNGHT